MCIVGFLQLRLLRYKKYRENNNLIVKIWQSYDKKMDLGSINVAWCSFLRSPGTTSNKKQQSIGTFHILWTKKLESERPIRLENSYWLQSTAPTTYKSRCWPQSKDSTNLKVSVDCNLYLQSTSKAEIFSNQWLQRHSKATVDCNQYFPQNIKWCIGFT